MVLKNILIFLFFAVCFFYVDPQGTSQERVSFIDTHAHIVILSHVPPFMRQQDPAISAIESMEAFGIQKSIVMPMPFSPNNPHAFDCAELSPHVRGNPQRFAFLCGGGSLNPMIQETSPGASEAVRETFKIKAEEILRSGAVGFGEMAAEHLSFHAGHPYESAPPDHPLFLLLADIAAQHDVPIDLHMEAVTHDMPIPGRFESPPNPGTLRENMVAFERLLSHNPKARIVWAHAGWDNTGDRTVALMRRLLQAHPNLYMNIKIDPQSRPETRPLDEYNRLRPEWLDLLRSFPDRFCVGTDEMYGMPMRLGMPRGPRMFLDQLPPDLARKVGIENAVRIYKI